MSENDIVDASDSSMAPFYGPRDEHVLTVTGSEGHSIRTEEYGPLLDVMAGYWYNTLPAWEESLVKVKRSHDGFSYHNYEGTRSKPAERLATKLTEYTGLEKVIYGPSGSMACENARKAAVKYHQAKGVDKGDMVFGAISGGYHGSVGANLDIIDPAESELLIESPCYKSEEEMRDIADNFRDRVERLESAGKKVAGFNYEYVMGVRGAVELPPAYLEPIAETCREKDILLMADEVTTGFGRTGEMFGYQHTGIKPDTMTLGKGFTAGLYPTSATLVDESIKEAWDALVEQGQPYAKTHRRGNGMAGTPEGAAVAEKVFDILQRDDQAIVRSVKEKGEYALDKLKELETLDAVREVRGKGLLQAIDVDDSGLAGDVQDTLRRSGINMLPEGRMLMFAPPFSIRKQEIDFFAETVRRALRRS